MSQQLRVLLVEDNPADVDLIRETLPERGPVVFQLEAVSRLSEALARLKEDNVDLVLLDLGLPDSQGLSTFQTLRAAAPDVATIVLTGNEDEELAITAVAHGAQDYLVKGQAVGNVLVRAARYAVERRRAEEALRESARKLKEAQRLGRIGRWEFDLETRQMRWSDVVFALYERDPSLGAPTREEEREYYAQEDIARLRECVRRTIETGEPYEVDVRVKLPGGRRLDVVVIGAPVRDSCGQVVRLVGTVQDITKRKEAERRERLARDVLELLNRPGGETDPIHGILQLVRESTGFDAVGIRLQEGEDFPYRHTIGFPADFVQGGRSVCARDATGEVVRDPEGRALLECLCGAVLSERTDATLPFFTPYGSFWTNDSTQLLASSIGKERFGCTCNWCNAEGYESIALIPLRSGSEVIGLLQLNGRRPHRLTPDMLQFLEGVSSSIGIAVSRKRAAEALQKNAARLGTLFEHSPISIWEEDFSDIQAHFGRLRVSGTRDFRAHFENHPDDVARCAALIKVLDVNQTSVRFFEASRKEELLSATHSSYLTPASLEVFKEELIALAGGATRFGSEVPIRTPAGGEKTLFLSLSVVPGCERTLAHVLVSFSDISERKQLEAQLRQAQKMEAVGQLAGGVAHDFNNILTVVSASCEFLEEGVQGSEPLLNDVRLIREASESAAKLTQQLLAFSRRQVLAPRVLDPNVLLRDSESMLARLLGEDVAIRLDLAPDVGLVRADPGQLEQVIVNLAVNARDAMPDGGTLTLATACVGLDDAYMRQYVDASVERFVMLAVTDTGCGMDEAILARVFEPFFTTKDKGKGTGLGLSTAYGIVKQSGGFIRVDSRAGQGTTFRIYLPHVASDQQPWRPTASPGVARPGTETVLLVEDNKSVRALAGRTLRKLGYTVLEANGLEEARRVAASEATIHLLLTDVVMPGGSGRDVSAAVRASHPTARVLYMSGYTDDAVVQRGVLEQDVAFLQKPFTPDSLGRRVREVLDGESAG